MFGCVRLQLQHILAPSGNRIERGRKSSVTFDFPRNTLFHEPPRTLYDSDCKKVKVR